MNGAFYQLTLSEEHPLRDLANHGVFIRLAVGDVVGRVCHIEANKGQLSATLILGASKFPIPARIGCQCVQRRNHSL